MTEDELKEKKLISELAFAANGLLVRGAFFWFLVRMFGVRWSFYYSLMMAVSPVLCFTSFSSFDLYRSWRGREYYREFFVIVKSWVVTIGILLLYFFMFKVSEKYSRSVILSWVFTYLFLVFAIHFGVIPGMS